MSAFTQAMRRVLPILLGGLMLMSGLAHAGTVTYVYTDPQGTPLAEADASGNITATFDYAPYGSQALGTPPDGPGYTGHVNDPESGLVYMQARYYDPAVGRFLSEDPVGPAAGNLFNVNRYDYANNNPIVNMDPDGRCTGSHICNTDGTAVSSGDYTTKASSAHLLNNRERSSLIGMSYKSTRMNGISGENVFFMDKSGKVLGKSDSGCEGDSECSTPTSAIPARTDVFGHNHVYPPKIGIFQNHSANMYREFPGPGDANPLKYGYISAIFMPSGARYVIDGSFKHPNVHYLGGGSEVFGKYVTEKWHSGITPAEIAKDITSFHGQMP